MAYIALVIVAIPCHIRGNILGLISPDIRIPAHGFQWSGLTCIARILAAVLGLKRVTIHNDIGGLRLGKDLPSVEVGTGGLRLEGGFGVQNTADDHRLSASAFTVRNLAG